MFYQFLVTLVLLRYIFLFLLLHYIQTAKFKQQILKSYIFTVVSLIYCKISYFNEAKNFVIDFRSGSQD